MRNFAPVLLTMLAGCDLRGGHATARWTFPGGTGNLSAPATGRWCRESRTILVQSTDADRVVGFSWHYDSLGAAEVQVLPPAPADSPAVAGSAALRYLRDGDTFGFRSVSGTLRVTAADPEMIDARVEAKLLRVGRTDSTELTAEFRRVRLVPDTTLCSR